MSATDIFCMCTNKKCKDGAENVMKKAQGLYIKKFEKCISVNQKQKPKEKRGQGILSSKKVFYKMAQLNRL